MGVESPPVARKIQHPGSAGHSVCTALQMIRAAIAEHTGVEPSPRQPPPRIAAYGAVTLTESALLLDNLDGLASGAAVDTEEPDIMEEYGQRCGSNLWRAVVCHSKP